MSSAGAGAGAGGAGQQKQKRNNLDSDHRDAVMAELLRGSSAGKLQKDDIQRVAVKFDSNRWPIARLRGLFFSSPVYDTDMNVRLLWRYCCGGTVVAVLLWRYCCGKGKKGKNEKVDASLPCYPPGNPGMLSGYPLGIPRGRFFSSPVYDMNVLLLLCLPTAVAVL